MGGGDRSTLSAMAGEERVALITGATGGLGVVVARTFGAAGWRLGLVGRDRDRLVAAAGEAGLADVRWTPGVGDLTDRSAAESAVGEIVGRFGRVDAVLHLVGGYAGGGSIAEFNDDDLRAMLAQHVWTTLNVCRAVAPGMVERGWGRIVAVSASTATTTPPNLAAYTVAKSAEEALLRTLARELSGSGVTVNVLVGRKIDTEHARESEPTPKNAPWMTPEEIAAAMLFLCSDDAAAITGARIPLDGRT
jgi:NAD(P)-dependent dehydrogenase (short-subunit alcohol dehydrogenase family)